MSDASTNQFGGSDQRGSRYVIRQTLIVRSSKPEEVLAALERGRIGEVYNLGGSDIVENLTIDVGAGNPGAITGFSLLMPAAANVAAASASGTKALLCGSTRLAAGTLTLPGIRPGRPYRLGPRP